MQHPSLAPDQITLLGTADDVALATSEVIRKFHDAFDHHDPGAMKDLVLDDCVIENTNPAPGRSPSRRKGSMPGALAGSCKVDGYMVHP